MIQNRVKELDDLVRKMIEDHEGGEIFFDNLDKAVQERPFIQQLLYLIGSKMGNEEYGVIVSGKFGRYFNNNIKIDTEIIVVNGGLRVGNPIDDLSFTKTNNKNFIFIDDSFYSGKTRDVIKKELERNNIKLTKTFVIYDGSKEKDEAVHSLYRYYDNFKEE